MRQCPNLPRRPSPAKPFRGQLVELKVSESSGHSVLDEAALEVLKKAAPLTLPQPLGRPQVVVQVPISYRLR